MLGVLLARDVDSLREVTKGEGEVETMLRIGGDLEGEFLVALTFEEAGDLVILVFGDRWEEFFCGF